MANGVTNDDQELNIESFESNNMPTGKNGKDTYSLEKEMRALSFLLGIFQKNGQLYIPLSKFADFLIKNFSFFEVYIVVLATLVMQNCLVILALVR